MVSPLRGAEGNVEFLAHLVARPATPTPATRPASVEVDVAVAGAVAEAQEG